MKIMEEFKSVFNEYYNALYNGKIKENYNRVLKFDRKFEKDKNFALLVLLFNEIRNDFLTSDREINAFMLTLSKMKKNCFVKLSAE